MADCYAVTTEGEEAIAASTAETLVQLRGATTTRGKVIAWGVAFDGATATDAPVLVRLLRQSTDGTASAATEVPFDPSAPAALITAHHSFSAEPTAGDVLEVHEVHPNGGALIREYALGREPMIDDATSSRIAIEVNGPACNAVAWLHWEE